MVLPNLAKRFPQDFLGWTALQSPALYFRAPLEKPKQGARNHLDLSGSAFTPRGNLEQLNVPHLPLSLTPAPPEDRLRPALTQ